MTAKVVDTLPEGEQWTYEVKFDGYWALLLKNGRHVQLRSRNDNDLSATHPTVAAAALRLNAETALLDGEIVALDAKGRPSFRALQHRSAHRDYAIVFYAFDLLNLNGAASAPRMPTTFHDVKSLLESAHIKPLHLRRCRVGGEYGLRPGVDCARSPWSVSHG